MTRDEFSALLTRQLAAARETLEVKGREYAVGSDRLENFKKMALLGETNPCHALWLGGLVKHLASVMQMVRNPARFKLETWREKVGDCVNYFLLLEACAIEAHGALAPSNGEVPPPPEELVARLTRFVEAQSDAALQPKDFFAILNPEVKAE